MSAGSTSVLGLRIDLLSKQEILDELHRTIAERKKKIFAYLNAHGANLAADSEELRRFFAQSDVVYADGQGIRLACRILSRDVPPHLPLSEWIWDILKSCEEHGHSVFLLGGTQEASREAAAAISRKYVHLTMAGSRHGYFEKEGAESQRVVGGINDATPDVLFIGFGMPSQEEWIRDNFEQLRVHAVFTAGGCIDVLSGKRRRVPALFRRLGLEWTVRLLEEPGRLAGRYLIGNPKFVIRVLAEKINKKRSEGEEKK